MVVNCYVAMYSYDYEGDTVIGVYETLERAEEAALKNTFGDWWSILPFEMNVTSEDPQFVIKQGKVKKDDY